MKIRFLILYLFLFCLFGPLTTYANTWEVEEKKQETIQKVIIWKTWFEEWKKQTEDKIFFSSDYLKVDNFNFIYKYINKKGETIAFDKIWNYCNLNTWKCKKNKFFDTFWELNYQYRLWKYLKYDSIYNILDFKDYIVFYHTGGTYCLENWTWWCSTNQYIEPFVNIYSKNKNEFINIKLWLTFNLQDFENPYSDLKFKNAYWNNTYSFNRSLISPFSKVSQNFKYSFNIVDDNLIINLVYWDWDLKSYSFWQVINIDLSSKYDWLFTSENNFNVYYLSIDFKNKKSISDYFFYFDYFWTSSPHYLEDTIKQTYNNIKNSIYNNLIWLDSTISVYWKENYVYKAFKNSDLEFNLKKININDSPFNFNTSQSYYFFNTIRPGYSWDSNSLDNMLKDKLWVKKLNEIPKYFNKTTDLNWFLKVDYAIQKYTNSNFIDNIINQFIVPFPNSVLYFKTSSVIYTWDARELYLYFFKKDWWIKKRIGSWYQNFYNNFYLLDFSYNKNDWFYYINYRYDWKLFNEWFRHIKFKNLNDLSLIDYWKSEQGYYLGNATFWNKKYEFFGDESIIDLENFKKQAYYNNFFIWKKSWVLKFFYFGNDQYYYSNKDLLGWEISEEELKFNYSFDIWNNQTEKWKDWKDSNYIWASTGWVWKDGYLNEEELLLYKNTYDNLDLEAKKQALKDLVWKTGNKEAVSFIDKFFAYIWIFTIPNDILEWNLNLKVPILKNSIENWKAKVLLTSKEVNLKPIDDKLNIISKNSDNNDNNLWFKFLTVLLWFLFIFAKLWLFFFFLLYLWLIYYFSKWVTDIIFPIFKEKKKAENFDLVSLWLFVIVISLLIVWYVLFLSTFWFYIDFLYQVNNFINLFFVLISKSFLDFTLFMNFLSFFNISILSIAISYLIYSINKNMLPKVKLPFISW